MPDDRPDPVEVVADHLIRCAWRREHAYGLSRELMQVLRSRGLLPDETLRRECEKYGLPVSLKTLLRHIENNHAATVGALKDSNETLRARLAEPVEDDDVEPLVTDILVALGDSLHLPEGPDVDDARAAVKRELRTFFRPEPVEGEAVAALRELVALKDGPRDAEYERRKPLAWERARRVVAGELVEGGYDEPAGGGVASEPRATKGSSLRTDAPSPVGLREALSVAADDLDKAANQFAGMRASQQAGHTPEIVSNPEKFASKAQRARAALSSATSPAVEPVEGREEFLGGHDERMARVDEAIDAIPEPVEGEADPHSRDWEDGYQTCLGERMRELEEVQASRERWKLGYEAKEGEAERLREALRDIKADADRDVAMGDSPLLAAKYANAARAALSPAPGAEEETGP